MQTKKEPTQYDLCGQDVLDIAKDLIRQFHSHLANKSIKFLFINKPITRNGRSVAATAEKIGDKIKVISEDTDFLITISAPVWVDLSEELRRYVLDHELCHCWVEEKDDGEEKNKILPHDFEDFTELIRRYGVLTPELQKLREILKNINNKEKNDASDEED